MPPKNATANSTRRKGPQFNPPRPVKAPAQASAAKRTPAAAAAVKKANVSAATIILSLEDEPDEEPEDAPDVDSDDLMEDAPVRDTARPDDSASPIPAALLHRLLSENFEDSNTHIQRGAMTLVEKYMGIFVREAFARAKSEREKAVRAGGIVDGFLQVEDLERLAPQLVLDF